MQSEQLSFEANASCFGQSSLCSSMVKSKVTNNSNRSRQSPAKTAADKPKAVKPGFLTKT